MELSQSLKPALLATTGDMIAGGMLELGTVGMGIVLGSAALGRGQVNGDVLTVPVEDVILKQEGLVAAARIRGASGVMAITGLTVGDEGSGANIVLGFRKLGPGAVVSLGTITIPQS